MLAEGEVIKTAPSNYADFFAGKWNTTISGTPQGDAKMLVNLTRTNGKLTGTITPEMDGAETIALDKVEEKENSVTIYFNMMSYDLNVELIKEDDNNLAGKLMGMFDVTSERVIEKTDFYMGDWKMTILGTPQGDAEMNLHFDRTNGELSGSITPKDGSTESVTLDTIEETDESVTIYFNMMNYDLNVKLEKSGEKSMEGKLMNMFDVTAEKK
jgi:cytochrome c